MDTARIDVDVAEHIQRVHEKFGCKEEKLWPITFVTNKEGKMDIKEFLKDMQGAITPLFPDALDKPGRHVLLKVNSGPGRMHHPLTLHPKHNAHDAGDGSVLWFLQDSVLEEP